MRMQGFFGRACENEALALEYNKPVIKDEAAFEYDYYSLPEVQGSEMQSSVEVRVQASFSSSSVSYWVARPELLLLKVASCYHMHMSSPILIRRLSMYVFHQCLSFSRASLDTCAAGLECLPWPSP